MDKELLRIGVQSAASALGFFCALAVNSYLDSRRERKACRTMLEAVKAEASNNEIILRDSFLKFYEDESGIVLREFFTETASRCLGELSFVKNAEPSKLITLGKYLRNIKLANAYRQRHERLRIDGKGQAAQEWLQAIVNYWGENLKQCEDAIHEVLRLPT